MNVSRRTLSGPLAVALALTLAAGSPAAFAAKPKPEPSPGKAPTAAALDPGTSLAAARAVARKTGQRVEAASERDETSTTWANPDGTLTTELSAGPVRFLRDGTWADVDLTLKTAADGSVAPAAHPNGLKLAGAGGKRPRSLAESRAVQEAPAGAEAARTLVSLGSGDDQLALEWRGGLPKPELNGTRATYRDAIGDGAGDLVVEATRTGFEQFVLLKQRPATGGYAYTMPLRAKGTKAEAQPDGSVLFTDRKNGQKRAVLPAPVMWDATTVPGSSEHPRQAKVGLEVVQRGDTVDLVFTPDAAFLAGRLVGRHRDLLGQLRHQERRRQLPRGPRLHQLEHRRHRRRPGLQRHPVAVQLPLRQQRLPAVHLGGVGHRARLHRLPVDRPAGLEDQEGHLHRDQGP